MVKNLAMLVLIALFGMVGQATASAQCFEYKPSEELKIDKLLEALGEPMALPGDTGKVPDAAERVFRKLESAMEKDKPDTILQKYSVNQILNLNNWHVDECTDERLEQRRKNCDSFCTKRQLVDGLQADKDRSVFIEAAPNVFIKQNLGSYCWAIINDMEANCPFDQLSTRLSEDDEKSVAIFQGATKLLNTVNPLRWLDKDRTNKAIRQYLDAQEPVKATKLWDSCSIMVEVLARPRGYVFKLEPYWVELIEFCKKFNQDFEPDDIKKIGHTEG